MMQGYFVTGTDTGVGKTLIASALVHAYAATGLKAAGVKPVASGCLREEGRLVSEDAAQLAAAANVELPPSILNPYALEPPLAPHIAAAQAGISLDLAVMQQACQQAAAMVDLLVVEGVGGFRVPFNEQQDSADLAVLLGLPLLLVVGMRLGCISHALLTVEAIAARGLPLAGWVANRVDPEMAAFDENLATLRRRLPAPCLGVLPFAQAPQPDWAARQLRIDVLDPAGRG